MQKIIGNQREKNMENQIKKRSSMYWLILFLWGILTILGTKPLIELIRGHFQDKLIMIGIILTVNLVFIVYFWLNGTKDILYVLYYVLTKKKHDKREQDILRQPLKPELRNAKVLLLYCTCDDFIEDSLLRSMQQEYEHFETIILDDSNSDEYKAKIDQFAIENKVKIVRRNDRIGFKAGNLNNLLKELTHREYDFFVILDSDEIIPKNFIQQAIKYFNYYPKLGIVQATHISTRNKSKFMKKFSIGVDAHWPTYQTIKETYGFLSFLGHGAMISYDCFQATEGFPELVAEDVCFTLEARLKGYEVAFSNTIVCQEEYPVDYYAFKKRHLKWTGGNLEFIKNYHHKIFSANNLRWFEKLDLFLFTYNLPMSSVFFVFLAINLVVLPILGYSAGYPLWLMTPTTIYLLSPMINDMIFLLGKAGPYRYFQYLFACFLLEGSLYWLSLYGATKSLLGIKARFIVTPKDQKKYSFREIIAGNYQEILFSIFLSLVSLIFTKSILPVILIVGPSLSGIYLISLAKELETDDEA